MPSNSWLRWISKAHASQHLHVGAIQCISRETQPDGLAVGYVHRPQRRSCWVSIGNQMSEKSFQGRMGMWMYLIDLECAWFQGPKIGTCLVLFGYLAAKHPGKEPKRRGFANGHGLNGKYVYHWIWWYFEVWIQNSWDLWGVSHSEVRTLECKPVFSCIEWNVVFAVLMLQIISFWDKDRLEFVRVDCVSLVVDSSVFFSLKHLHTPYMIFLNISELFQVGDLPCIFISFPIRVTCIILTIHGSWISRATVGCEDGAICVWTIMFSQADLAALPLSILSGI